LGGLDPGLAWVAFAALVCTVGAGVSRGNRLAHGLVHSSAVVFALLCVGLLCGALVILRARKAGVAGPSEGRHAVSPRSAALGAVGVLAGSAPLFVFAPWRAQSAEIYTGDAVTHAAVAREIAEHGLPHGWLTTFLGGFPFGHHYPPLGWLLTAGLMRLGLAPARSLYWLGWIATFALPFAMYAAALRVRARPAFAALGAVFVLAVSPYNPFVGGYEAFFTSGLISQVLALPLVVLAMGEIARGSRASAVPLAALAIAAHPEVGAASMVLAVVGSVVARNGRALETAALAASAAAAFGLALYGQGLTTLGVPFGWPPDFGWRRLGFGFRRWDWWLFDGDLLDRDSALMPLTALAGAALLVALFCPRRPGPRAAVTMLAIAMLASSLGPTLDRLGGVATLALAFLQPLRVLALMPLVAAALVIVALEEATLLLEPAMPRRRARAIAPLVGLAAAVPIALALPNRFAAGHAIHARFAGAPCARAPLGYDATTLRRWLGALPGGGRVWFDQSDEGPLAFCAERDGLVVASSVPVGITSGVGSHIGIEWLAARQLELARPNATARAEALGVRYVLDVATPSEWRELRRVGTVVLAERPGGTDLVGVGCVSERWKGSDDALRERLSRELTSAAGADRLLDPAHFTLLERAAGVVVASRVALDGCDATGASVTPHPREPGALEASIEGRAPLDVVFRATAFPSWRVTLDGKRELVPHQVAPGFFVVRVPAGRHHVVAVVSSLPGYAFALAAGVLAVLALGFAPHPRTLLRRRADYR
jgi:hypothetical protein